MQFFRNILHWLKQILIGEEKSNFRAGVLCIILAITFWFLNTLNEEHTYRLALPVNFEYINEQREKSDYIKEVQFTVAGKGWYILQTQLDSRRKVIPFISNQEENYIVASSLRNFITQHIHTDLRIIEIPSDTFFLTSDRIIRKKVKLLIDSNKIQLAQDYKIISPIKIVPNQILIEGLSKPMDAFPDSLYITLSENIVNKKFDKNIDLSFLSKKGLRPLRPYVHVSFEVEKFITGLHKVAIRYDNLPENWPIDAQYAEVIYTHRAEDEPKIRWEEFEVVADFKRINREDSTLGLQIKRVPERMKEAKLVTNTIKVSGGR